MRLSFATKAAAETKAAAIHQWMVANNNAYAASVQAGKTLRWAIPYQDTDENGKVLSVTWYVNVKERCMGALSAAEKLEARA